MIKNIKQYIPVFLSSTRKDLIPYRKAILDTLNKMKVGIRGMEVFGARTEKALEACLNEVSKSQYFIGVIGMRYGSLDEKTGKSIIQLEYEKAIEKSLKILIYLINEEKVSAYPLIFVDRDANAKKLEEFKEILKNNHMVEFFESPKDLTTKVERDLLRLFSEKGLVIEKEKLKPTVEPEKTIELLRKFDLMPKRYIGSEFELILKLSGESQSVSKEICHAIGLLFGHSLSRSIKILHPPRISNTFDFLDRLYAEYEECDFLYNVSEDKEIKIIARLAFGQQRIIVIQPKEPFPLQPGLYSRIYYPGPSTIKNIETDAPPFVDYVEFSPVKAIILVKIISKSKL